MLAVNQRDAAGEEGFHFTANADPQRDSHFTKGPSDMRGHATSEIASGSKMGFDATEKLPGEGFKRAGRSRSRKAQR